MNHALRLDIEKEKLRNMLKLGIGPEIYKSCSKT